MITLIGFKQGLIFISLVIGLTGVLSCSSNSPARKETLSQLRESGKDIEDLRRWFVLSDLRKFNLVKASFVLNADNLKAYILFKESVISSMGTNKLELDQKFYTCPKYSKYCSMCINLKNLTLTCSVNKDDSYSSNGAIMADNQTVSIRKIVRVDENVSATKLVFSGMPAKFIFNTSSNSNEKKMNKGEHYKFSRNTESDPEVVCKQNMDSVTCNATVALANL
ncbi:MAG: hypothetical protein NTY22_03485 [Proteobacteria bacterium]|nr:hypothetical protein [Pseudomonadota bacterium]